MTFQDIDKIYMLKGMMCGLLAFFLGVAIALRNGKHGH